MVSLTKEQLRFRALQNELSDMAVRNIRSKRGLCAPVHPARVQRAIARCIQASIQAVRGMSK